MKETLIYSDYAVYEQKREIGFHCPRCRTVLEPLVHGGNCICECCHLVMELWGNTLECSDESEEDE